MFSLIFVFFIAFMLVSALSLDGKLRGQEEDSVSLSPAKTKSLHSKIPSEFLVAGDRFRTQLFQVLI